MSKSSNKRKAAGVTRTSTRVDGAHRTSAAEVPVMRASAPELVAAAVGHSAVHAVEQFERQTEQIGQHLRDQSRDIDRREAQLNAYLAQLDSDARAARLLLVERTQELAQRETEHYARLREVAMREAQLEAQLQSPAAEHGVDDGAGAQRWRDLHERQIRIEAEEQRQRFSWQRLEARRAADMQLMRQLMRSLERRRLALDDNETRHAAEEESRNIQLEKERRATELDAREQEIAAARDELEERRAELACREECLAQQARQFAEQSASDQALAEQARQRDQDDLAVRELVLRRRSDELGERQAALDQMQAEVTRTHREALEMRLATEQLWSQMGGKLSPEQLAESLRRLRAKLTDHFRLADDSLTSQKSELRELAARLDAQHQKIQGDRQELRAWAERRQEEIEGQAARLVAREQQLEEQQAELATQGEKIARQRDEYEDEIRRMKSELALEKLLAAA